VPIQQNPFQLESLQVSALLLQIQATVPSVIHASTCGHADPHQQESLRLPGHKQTGMNNAGKGSSKAIPSTITFLRASLATPLLLQIPPSPAVPRFTALMNWEE